MPHCDPSTSFHNKYFDFVIFSSGISFPLCGLVVSIHSVVYPDWSVYYTYLLPYHPVWVRQVGRVFSAIRFIYALQSSWSLLVVIIELILINTRYIWLILTECVCDDGRRSTRKIISNRQHALPSLRKAENLRMIYIQLEILHNHFLDFTGVLIIPIYAIVLNLVLFSNFSLIRYWDKLNLVVTGILLIWSVYSALLLVVMFGFFGNVHSLGAKVLKTISNKEGGWGRRIQTKEMKKFVKSRKLLSYGFEKIFVIRRISVLKFLKAATYGTFKLLLTIKK